MRPARPVHGFTLIEILITIVIIAVLAAIAFPTYIDSVRKSRRSEAFTAIAGVQQAQERWRGSNAAYAGSVSAAVDADPPGLGLSETTPSGYYTLGVASADATGYVVTATGVSGTSQGDDPDCRRLAVRMQNGNLQYAGCGDCESFTFTNTHACWAR